MIFIVEHDSELERELLDTYQTWSLVAKLQWWGWILVYHLVTTEKTVNSVCMQVIL